jgi:hypothetical protein
VEAWCCCCLCHLVDLIDVWFLGQSRLILQNVVRSGHQGLQDAELGNEKTFGATQCCRDSAAWLLAWMPMHCQLAVQRYCAMCEGSVLLYAAPLDMSDQLSSLWLTSLACGSLAWHVRYREHAGIPPPVACLAPVYGPSGSERVARHNCIVMPCCSCSPQQQRVLHTRDVV